MSQKRSFLADAILLMLLKVRVTTASEGLKEINVVNARRDGGASNIMVVEQFCM